MRGTRPRARRCPGPRLVTFKSVIVFLKPGQSLKSYQKQGGGGREGILATPNKPVKTYLNGSLGLNVVITGTYNYAAELFQLDKSPMGQEPKLRAQESELPAGAMYETKTLHIKAHNPRVLRSSTETGCRKG